MSDTYSIIITTFAIIIGVALISLTVMKRCAERLVTVSHTIKSTKGKDAHFAFISDVHIGKLPVKWRNIYETIKDGKPEFVIIGGDLCNRITETGRAVDFVYGLYQAVRVPVYITMGNHDNAVFSDNQILRQEFIAMLEETGPDVHVLDDEAARNGDITIYGLDDVHHREHKTLSLPEADIVVSHNADILLDKDIDKTGNNPDLWLFGHTHGGQIHMPFNFEFAVLKKDKLPKKGIFYGLHNYNGKTIYISSGLGCSLAPIRFGSNPEVVFIDLDGENND